MSKAAPLSLEEKRLKNKLAMREWRAKNPDRAREAGRKSDAKRDHSERSKRWRSENPKKRESYRQANLEKWARNTRDRAAQMKKALPPWGSLEEIDAIHQRASELRSLGHDVQVDHIFPLQGKLISGLHVANNLRIVSREENLRKGNRVLDCEGIIYL